MSSGNVLYSWNSVIMSSFLVDTRGSTACKSVFTTWHWHSTRVFRPWQLLQCYHLDFAPIVVVLQNHTTAIGADLLLLEERILPPPVLVSPRPGNHTPAGFRSLAGLGLCRPSVSPGWWSAETRYASRSRRLAMVRTARVESAEERNNG